MKNNSENLVNFFKLFKNRPHHLTRFLLDQDALTDKFLKKINNNQRLTEIERFDTNESFNSIDEMKDHFSLYINDVEINSKKKTKEEVIDELTQRIKDAVDNENYEEAAKIRDYMIRNNLKKN
jgi:protein-arginine kinase activator protein McsA